MKKLAMCRICLVEDVRMYVVVDKNLQQLYEKLTDVPFVTEDGRPMLACFFCCAKIKQCAQFQRKCLEAEERFAKILFHMLNQDCKPASINHGQLEFYGGFIKTPVEHMSTDDEYKLESNAIKEELPDVCERDNNNIKQEEPQSNELEQKYLHDSYTDIEDIPRHHSEAHSEDDVSKKEIKTEIEEHEVSNELNKRTAMETESATDAKKTKLDVQKYIKDNSISLKYRKQGQDKHIQKKKTEKNKITLTTTNYYGETEQAISNIDYSKAKPKVPTSNNAIYNKANNKETKCKDISASSQCVGNDEFKCKICNYNGINSSDIERHSLRHSNLHVKDRPHKCDICQSSFSLKGNLTKHIRTHSGEKPYKCDICQSSYSRSDHLTAHFRTHTGEKPYKCDICHSSFNKSCNLKSHMRTHTGEKPHKCDICQSTFNHVSHLKTHIRTHSGEKPYKCDICQSSFNKLCNLKLHIRTHTGEKPYKCDICQSRFKQVSHLKTHIRTHAGNSFVTK